MAAVNIPPAEDYYRVEFITAEGKFLVASRLSFEKAQEQLAWCVENGSTRVKAEHVVVSVEVTDVTRAMTNRHHPTPWRQGRQVPRNVYDARDQPIMMCADDATAEFIVTCVNQATTVTDYANDTPDS